MAVLNVLTIPKAIEHSFDTSNPQPIWFEDYFNLCSLKTVICAHYYFIYS